MKNIIDKSINLLEKFLLINLSIFILLAPFSQRAVRVTAAVGGGLWILIVILKYKKEFYKHMIPNMDINKPFSFFIIACLLSVIFSQNFYYSQKIFFQWFFYYFLFFLLGIFIAKRERIIIYLTYIIILGGLIIGVGGMHDYFQMRPHKLISFFGSFINIGPFLAMYIPFNLIVCLLSKNKILRLFSAINVLILGFCLINGMLEATWVALIFSVSIVLFFKNKLFSVITFSLLSIMFLVTFFKLGNEVNFISDLFYDGGRIKLWKVSFEIFKYYPLFGIGISMFRTLGSKYAILNDFMQIIPHQTPHNDFFKIMAETGFFGTIAFLWIFISFFKNFSRMVHSSINKNLKSIQLAFNSLIIAGLIYGFFWQIAVVELQNAVLFWFFLGVSSRIIYQIKVSQSKNKVDLKEEF